MAILLELPSETEALLIQQAKNSGKDIGQYIASLIRPQKPTMPPLSKRETVLFSVINLDFPASVWNRFHQLAARRADSTLTQTELDELIQISEALEENNAKKMKAFVELSKLRGVDLDSLIAEFGTKHAQNF